MNNHNDPSKVPAWLNTPSSEPPLSFAMLLKLAYDLSRAEDQVKAAKNECGAQWCHEPVDTWGECGLCTTHAFKFHASD